MQNFKLSIEEREKIFYYLTLKKSYREIGLLLGRSHTTISREIDRNTIEGEYSPSRAEAQNRARLCKSGRKNKIDTNIDLFEEVFQRIFQKWSPEQISAYLKEKFHGNLQMQISHESIYKYIYACAKGELKKHLLKYLRQKGRKNINRKLSHEKRGQIPEAISIHERPKEAESRAVPGHWEGDLIMGKDYKTALGVLVERTTRFVFIAPLKGKKAKDVREAFTDHFLDVPENLKISLTYDRGKEMVEHKQFSEDTGIPVYFADPHSPWQRGSCENTNGLIRDFFPKGTDFSKISYEEIKHVQDMLNERIRKTLNWKSPEYMFNKLIGAIKT
jgi:transposase, IS30 family